MKKLTVVKRFFALIIALIFTNAAFSQTTGRVTGKVINKKNEAVVSASIKVDGETRGTATNVEGRYILNLPVGKKYTLTISSVGYQTKSIDEVTPVAGQETEIDIVLEDSKKNELQGVVVRASTKKETVNALIQFQKNTNTVSQVISAEAIRRSPDRNTGEVLKRVPGTSVQEGKYLVVRGLADRYNQAMLNGILLSSTEPDRKTFSFDIFPAAVIDNIIINKAFVPELPGEWAGGLVQVNTKDIPSTNFFNVQIGTGFNTNVVGEDIYTYKGSNTDFLGFDNKTRKLPDNIPTKFAFGVLSDNDKLSLGRAFAGSWAATTTNFTPNTSLQLNGGFSTKVFKKKVGGVIAINYNRSLRNLIFKNSFFTIADNKPSPDLEYNTNRHSQDVLWGAIANFSMQLNNNNKISVKNLININSSNYASLRTGQEFISGVDNIRSNELAMRTNIFYNTQLLGEHNMPSLKMKFNWFGSFNILDQYIPKQRRLEYIQDATVPGTPFTARISTGQSQKSGSIFYSSLSDYIYTGGGDLTKNFTLFDRKQAVKIGYMLQVKDRLFDSRPFFIKLFDNNLKTLAEDQIFAPENFVPGKLGFDEFVGKQYRYIANTILNAGYIQFDNLLTEKLRAVWGVRFESFDQLIGSVKKSDPRFVNSVVEDFLPAINLTYKVNNQTNIRLSASQTVVRPEFRELTNFAFFDFELGATVLGNLSLKRTKITNADLRYEIYPRAGELFTLGVFYKYFDSPIELYFNQSGAGSSNTFNFLNADNAKGFGIEFEMRKKLDFISAGFKNFTVTSNLSYINNEVTSGSANLNRPMQGQSPYIINAGLQYDIEKYGLSTTLLFNQIGRRIAYVGNDQIPAIWEAPRPLLDFQLAKKVAKGKGEVRMNISDIFNRRAFFYHDLDESGKYNGKGSKDALAIERIYGTTFSITFGYNFVK
jgi:CarboxypepD_reg-like domain/TonB dependent receptor/TonB-dependent Receptor Plug Domain